MTTPVLRDAIPADFRAIQDIYAHHVLHGCATFEEIPPEAGELRRRWEVIRGAGLSYLVAEAAGAVAGYAYAAPYRPRSAYRFAVEDSIYIRHDMTGKGIGRSLLAALIARCEAGPWRQMLAVIGDSGNAGSIALHKATGFTDVGIFRAIGFKRGRWVDTVLMQRALGPGDETLPESVDTVR